MLLGNLFYTPPVVTAPYILGQLVSTDPNLGDHVTYSLSGGVNEGAFILVSGNMLALSIVGEMAPTLQVIVRATDTTALNLDVTFTITSSVFI